MVHLGHQLLFRNLLRRNHALLSCKSLDCSKWKFGWWRSSWVSDFMLKFSVEILLAVADAFGLVCSSFVLETHTQTSKAAATVQIIYIKWSIGLLSFLNLEL